MMTNPSSMTSTRRLLLAAAVALSLTACATPPAQRTLADSIAQTPQLSTLNQLIARAGLTENLQTGGPFTVLAPSNDAFKDVPAKTLADLSQNPEKLKNLLQFHMLTGKLLSAQVKNSNIKTVQGSTVAISKAGDFVTIENAAVVTADLEASNGVVHIIDTVLTAPAK